MSAYLKPSKMPEISDSLALYDEQFISAIPEHLVICSINFDLERHDLYIIRYERNNRILFKLPSTRQATRLGENNGLDYNAAESEYQEIMKNNKSSTQNAKDCSTSIERKKCFKEERD